MLGVTAGEVVRREPWGEVGRSHTKGEAAATKPFGFTPFYPGPGLGGHCIPIDPVSLTWKAREYGFHTRYIELAGEVNTAMPDHVLARLREGLDRARRGLRALLTFRSIMIRTLVVVHCYREQDAVIRIISARKATRRERDIYNGRWRT